MPIHGLILLLRLWLDPAICFHLKPALARALKLLKLGNRIIPAGLTYREVGKY